MSGPNHYLHDPAFNGLREQAHDFVAGDLGQNVMGVHSVAMVPSERWPELLDLLDLSEPEDQFRDGWYASASREAFIKTPPEAEEAGTLGQIRARVAVAHELGHDAAEQGSPIIGNMFPEIIIEGVAGFAEHMFLADLVQRGGAQPARTGRLEHDGLTFWVPGEFWMYDGADGMTSSGLVAAHAFALAAKASGISGEDVLCLARKPAPTQFAHFHLMERSLDSLHPGLSLVVRDEAILESLARVQDIAARKGLLPSDIKSSASAV